MIFLILGVLFLIFIFFTDNDDFKLGLLFSIVLFFGMAGFPFIFSGSRDYAYLQEKRIEIQVLEKGIEDVRSAYYKQKTISKNNFINGSIENMKQSTNLSLYISRVIKKKAEYNAYLKRCQIYESEFIYNLLYDGFFISSKVQEMEAIK